MASTVTLDTIVALDTVVSFVIPVVALLTSSTVMWCGNTFRMFLQSKEKACYTLSVSLLVFELL
jgi:hypothetical protein